MNGLVSSLNACALSLPLPAAVTPCAVPEHGTNTLILLGPTQRPAGFYWNREFFMAGSWLQARYRRDKLLCIQRILCTHGSDGVSVAITDPDCCWLECSVCDIIDWDSKLLRACLLPLLSPAVSQPAVRASCSGAHRHRVCPGV